MSILSPFKKIHDSLLDSVLRYFTRRHEMDNIHKKHHLYSHLTLSPEQKERIDTLFIQNYGKKFPYDWHLLYQSYLGVFCENYFPEILFSTKLEPLLNPKRYTRAFEDKNMVEIIVSGLEAVRCPQTYLACIGGTFRDGYHQILNKEEAVSSLSNIGSCVVKKTIDTSSGRDVMMCEFREGVDTKSGSSVEQVFEIIGDDFIIQERISQWHELASLYPNSLNTFRVMTYIIDGEIKLCPLALRMGRNGADRDNIHYGGIVVGVSNDGYLKDCAFSEYQERFPSHPDSGMLFSGCHIQHIDRIIGAAKKLHAKIPQLKCLSWDLTLDVDGVPVLIEINMAGQSSWFPQMVNGEALFGDDTPKMLQLIRK